MALLISHRGNTEGMVPDRENSPEYVKEALEKGFYVVADVWLVGTQHLALGTNHPQYPVTAEFLKENNIICRAKTVQTLYLLLQCGAHCFMYGKDDYVMTNGGLVWTAPGKIITPRSVFTMPEWVVPDITSIMNVKCSGICSDRIQEIKDTRDKLKKKELEAVKEEDEEDEDSSDKEEDEEVPTKEDP